MKTNCMKKLAIAGEVVTELSAGGLIILQLVVMVVLWMLLSGSGQILASLPNWSLAVAGGGAASLMVSAFLLKRPQLFFVPATMIALLAIQIGSANTLVSSPGEAVKIGNALFPSLADVVQGFSWLIVIGLALGGIVSIGLLATIKADKCADTEANN